MLRVLSCLCSQRVQERSSRRSQNLPSHQCELETPQLTPGSIKEFAQAQALADYFYLLNIEEPPVTVQIDSTHAMSLMLENLPVSVNDEGG